MTSKFSINTIVLLLLAAEQVACQEIKNRLFYDIEGRPLIVSHEIGDTAHSHDYFTESGDTLRSIPFIYKEIEYVHGYDSLMKEMVHIYGNYIEKNKGVEFKTDIALYMLFDSNLNIVEVRSFVLHKSNYVIGLCHELEDFVESAKWRYKPDCSYDGDDYFFTIVPFRTTFHSNF